MLAPLHLATLGTAGLCAATVLAALWLRADATHQAEERCIAEKEHVAVLRQARELEAINAALAADNLAREREIETRSKEVALSKRALDEARDEAEALRKLADAKDANTAAIRSDDPWLAGLRRRQTGDPAPAPSPGR